MTDRALGMLCFGSILALIFVLMWVLYGFFAVFLTGIACVTTLTLLILIEVAEDPKEVSHG